MRNPGMILIALALCAAGAVRLLALASAGRRLWAETDRLRRETDHAAQAARALRAQNNARARDLRRDLARRADEGMWAPHHLSECKNIRCPRHAAGGRWMTGPHPGERR